MGVRGRIPGVAAAVLISSGVLAAQLPSAVVHWSAKPATASVIPGTTLKVALTATIESGWHIYAMTQPDNGPIPMTIAVPSAPGFQMLVKRIESPPPIVTRDPTFQSDTHYYEKEVTLTVPFAVRGAAKPGKQTIPIEITYQACSNRICLRPFTEKLSVEVSVAGGVKGKVQ